MKYIFNILYNSLWDQITSRSTRLSLCVRLRMPLFCLGTMPNRFPSEILIETENCLISTKKRSDTETLSRRLIRFSVVYRPYFD